MKTRNWLYWSLVAISGLTVLSGFVQTMPQVLLRGLSAENTGTSRHLSGTIGMFMVVVGGALLHALLSPFNNRVLVLWAALQKFGASTAVVIGVRRAIFSPLALFVASFDFLSGLLIMWYWVRTSDDSKLSSTASNPTIDTVQTLRMQALSGGKV